MLEHEQKNVWKMIGMRIRRERIKRNWSQSVIRQIKRCRFHQIKTGLSEHLTMG